MAGIDFILNVVLNKEGHAVAGHPVQAHGEGYKFGNVL